MLHGLSGTLWPIHLKPLPDELFSSWVIRFAHAHGYKTESMCRHLFGRDHVIWNRDIDRFAPDPIKIRMMDVSGATNIQVQETTLSSLEGFLFNRLNRMGNSSWILPLGIAHRTRKKYGLMYCPACLTEDPLPYYRKNWRLAFSTVCVKHRIQLLDKCEFCSAPIAPHRIDMGGTPWMMSDLLRYCYNCRKGLHKANSVRADSTLIIQQTKFETSLDSGFVECGLNPTLYSPLFFDGLRVLISGLMSRSVRSKLTSTYSNTYEFFEPMNFRNFENSDLALRRSILKLVAALMKDWPNDFIGFLGSNRISYSDLKIDEDAVPYWYGDVVKRAAYRPFYVLDRPYVNSIVKATESRFGFYNQNLVQKFSGRNINSKHVYFHKEGVSAVAANRLLHSLDSEIENALSKLERIDLIRDKVMIGLCKACDLSILSLSNFNIRKCQALSSQAEILDFSSWPQSLGQARVWGEWFYYEVRPAFSPLNDEEHLFLSRVTARPLKKSSISLRFHRAIKAANLDTNTNLDMWRRKI